MNKMWLVAKEVFRKNVKSWAFFWMVAAPFIMGLVIMGIGYFVYQDQTESSVGNVGIVNASPIIKEEIEALEDDNVYFFDEDVERAGEKLKAGELDGYLVIDESKQAFEANFYRLNSGKKINTNQIAKLLSDYNLKNRAEDLSLNAEQVDQLRDSEVKIETIRVQEAEDGTVKEVSEDDPLTFAKKAVAYIVSIVVFVFIMNYSTIVSQEIAAEKGSRIMEIVLSSISAAEHFFGKLVGVAMVILAQLAIYGVLGFLTYYVLGLVFAEQLVNSPGTHETVQQAGQTVSSGASSFDFSVISSYLREARPILLYGILFAVLGIIIYSVISAFLGSLVSKTEDVNKMIAPLSLIGVAGFYIAIYAIQAPNSPVVRYGSLFPMFTPFIMPFRLANDSVTTPELWLSVGIVALFLVVCVYLSVVFYKSNVLVYTDKGLISSIKQSFSIWKNEKKK